MSLSNCWQSGSRHTVLCLSCMLDGAFYDESLVPVVGRAGFFSVAKYAVLVANLSTSLNIFEKTYGPQHYEVAANLHGPE